MAMIVPSAALVSATVGTIYGAISGYAGGRFDSVMMRFVDILYALPYMFLVIILVTILGSIIVVGPLIMWIIGLIEGIMYLTKSDEEFVATYITGRKGWF